MKKKLMAFVLAGAMMAGSSFAVSAADVSGGDDFWWDVSGGEDVSGSDFITDGVEITGISSMNLPTVNMIVPTTANIVLNPYKLEYRDANGKVSNQQVISMEQEIVNLSNVGIAVNVENLKAQSTTNVNVVETSTSKMTDKSVFLYLTVADMNAKLADVYNDETDIVIPAYEKGTPASKEDAVFLEAGNVNATRAKFRIGGNMVATPTMVQNGTTVENPWQNSDKVFISFKFTFTPQVSSTNN